MKTSLAAVALAVSVLRGQAVLVRNADVYPVSRPHIPNTSVLVRDGKIVAVGEVAAPAGIQVVDATGLRLYPGFIDSGTELGLSEVASVRETVDTGEFGEFMPQLRAIVAVNPESEHFPVARSNGITAAVTFPALSSGKQIITGQAALLHTDGWTWEDMAVDPSVAVHVAFPKDVASLSSLFAEGRRYREAKLAGTAPRDLRLEALLPILEGRRPLAISAPRVSQIRAALDFAYRERVRIVLVAPRELGPIAVELKARGIPVVFGRTLALPLRDDDRVDAAYTLPAEAYRAGLKIAFGTFNNQFVRDLPYNAATAVAYGLPYDEALKALTTNPAEIWGVENAIGSIEVGKSADFFLADGDPLEARTQVRAVYIKGVKSNLESRQTRLYAKYRDRR